MGVALAFLRSPVRSPAVRMSPSNQGQVVHTHLPLVLVKGDDALKLER